MKLRLLFAAALPFCLAGCGDKPAEDAGKSSGGSTPSASAPTSKGTEAEVKELLAAFVKEGADRKALTAALKPDKADYEAVFVPEFAAKIEASHAALWAKKPALGPSREEQTEYRIKAAVPTAEIKAWGPGASQLPGGYKDIKDNFKDGFTVYAFDFIKPGEQAGMAFSGLVHVNGHWRLFPDPHRVK